LDNAAVPPAVISYAEHPELWQDSEAVSEAAWPEYSRHGDVLSRYWGRLPEDFPEFQFVLCDERGDALGAPAAEISPQFQGRGLSDTARPRT
jgi:hypothetical protein